MFNEPGSAENQFSDMKFGEARETFTALPTTRLINEFTAMTNYPLNLAVDRYEAAISALKAAAENVSAEQILEALAARNLVHTAITNLPPRRLSQTIRDLLLARNKLSRRRLLHRVSQLDVQLSQQADFISQAVRLDDWRILLHPSERQWLELLTLPRWHDRFDWLWQGLSIAFLTVCLSLLTDIATRFLEGGPDAVGAFAVIVPSVLGLLTGGGALTQTGRLAIENILSSLKIAKHWWDELLCLASGLLLAFLLCFWLSLPLIANIYLWLGDNAYAYCFVAQPSDHPAAWLQGKCKLARVERRYSRAIKLNPNNAVAHYKLGNFYEFLGDTDQAISQYQVAVRGDLEGEAYRAFDRLTRLYILAGSQKDDQETYSKAISLSERGLKLLNAEIQDDPIVKEVKYALHKNQGWAYLRQHSYTEAKSSLEEAVKLFEDKASAQCLLAQTLEQLKELQPERVALEQCVAYADQNNPDEANWIGLARKRLQQLQSKGVPS